MAAVIRMPSVLAGSEEAAIVDWLVAAGDSISVGDPLAEIETEKAIVEYSAEEAGIVGRLVLAPGQSGEIGAPIAVLIAEGETESDIDAALGDGVVSSVDAGTGPTEPAVANGQLDSESSAPVVEAASQQAAEEPASETCIPSMEPVHHPQPVQAPAVNPARRFASPIARKIARDRQLDLSQITGTGPGGRIVRRDLDALLPTQATPVAVPPTTTAQVSLAPAPSAGGPAATDPAYDVVPHTGMRKAIARRLTESKSTVPHFYLTAECRVDEVLALRAQINRTSPRKISVNDFVVKAVAGAFVDVPEANVTWAEDGMRVHRTVDISVAVATDGGLVTPVIRDVAAASLSSVSGTIAELVQKARDKRLKQEELEGGSFSVTNLGMYGTQEFSAILNPPQSGILAVGAAAARPVVTDDQLAIATVMRCTLSVDHRAVDGALAARWLAAFTNRIENPLMILV